MSLLLALVACATSPWAEWEADRPSRERRAQVQGWLEADPAVLPSWAGPEPEPVPDGLPRVVLTPEHLVLDHAAWEAEGPRQDEPEIRLHFRAAARSLVPLRVALADGRVSDDQKRGQLISALYDALLATAESHKDLGARWGDPELEFRGEIAIAAHPEVPFATVREVLFTAGQAQYGRFTMEVDGGAVDWVTPGDQRWMLVLLDDGTVAIQRERAGMGSVGTLGVLVEGRLQEPPPEPEPQIEALEVPARDGRPDVAAVAAALHTLQPWIPERRGVVVLPSGAARWGDVLALSELNRSSPQAGVLSPIEVTRGDDWTSDLQAFAAALGPVPALLQAEPTLADRLETHRLEIEAESPIEVQLALQHLHDRREEALTLTSLRGCVLPALRGREPEPGRLVIRVTTTARAARVQVSPGPLRDTGVVDCLVQSWSALPTAAAPPAQGLFPWLGLDAPGVPPATIRWVVDVDGGPAAAPALGPDGRDAVAALLDDDPALPPPALLEAVAAHETAPALARGRAVVALAQAGRSDTLERLALEAEPRLVRAWAVAALVRRAGPRALQTLAPLATDPTVAPAFVDRLRALDQVDARALVELAHAEPGLLEPLGELLAATDPDALADVALRHGDTEVRRLATRVVGAHPQGIDAWLRGLDPERHRDPPWRGGALFLPTLDREDPRTTEGFDTLARWVFRCERACPDELDALIRALNSLPVDSARRRCSWMAGASELRTCLEALEGTERIVQEAP